MSGGGAAGSAFGLTVHSAEPIPGLHGRVGAGGVPVTVTLAEAEPVVPTLEGGEELMSRRAADGRLVASVSRDGAGRYRIYGAGFGAYDVEADASEITCRPPAGCQPWMWQRFLMSQALPLVATLRGTEPFHASGVVVHGHVLAIAGTTGSGKSSLTLSLAARGLPFFTDDVLAVARDGDDLVCLPGPGAANIRDPDLRRVATEGRPPFGDVIGETPDGMRVLVRGDGRERPLGAVYFIDHRPDGGEVQFESAPAARMLLGHTFNVLVQTPDRLATQLALCSAIAQAAELVHVRVPRGTPVAQLAMKLERHARGCLGTRQTVATAAFPSARRGGGRA